MPSSLSVFVLLYKIDRDQEGIHTLRIGDRSLVLMFEDEDDATRYAMLLEAQDFMVPSVECLDREEVEDYCRDAGYESRLVPQGFIPQNDFDRLLLSPPEKNLDLDLSDAGDFAPGGRDDSRRDDRGSDLTPAPDDSEASEFSRAELDSIRRRLEGLL
jgi:hypothetical protein